MAQQREPQFHVGTSIRPSPTSNPLSAEGEPPDEPRDRRTRSSKLQPPPPPQALGCFRRFRLSGRHRPQRKGRTDCARGASHGRHQAIDGDDEDIVLDALHPTYSDEAQYRQHAVATPPSPTARQPYRLLMDTGEVAHVVAPGRRGRPEARWR